VENLSKGSFRVTNKH